MNRGRPRISRPARRAFRSTTAAALVVPLFTLGATAALTLVAPAAAHAQLEVGPGKPQTPTLSVAPIGEVPFGSQVTVTTTLTDPGTGATILGAPITVTVDNQPVSNPF